MSSALIRRTSVRAAALSAAALLALTGCSGGTDDGGAGQTTEATAATDATSPAATDADGATETGTDEQAEETAQAASFEPGDCLTADPGIRNVASFETVDCEGEHTAEYLWAVPAPEEGAEAEADAPTTEEVCRAQAAEYVDEVEVALTATELRNADDQSQHCILYSVTDPWTGQVADPSITLDEALDQG